MGMLITSHDVGDLQKRRLLLLETTERGLFSRKSAAIVSSVFFITSNVYLLQSKSMPFMDSLLEVFRYRPHLINSALMKMRMQIHVYSTMHTSNPHLHVDANSVIQMYEFICI